MSEPRTVPTVTFNNGIKFPCIGLGTWQTTGDEMTEIIKSAIDIGYRMIDTAFIYGNEKIVGEAIKSKIAEGIIKREDIFITTKLWITDQQTSQIIPACKRSLASLGLDYIDLYLIHWPVAVNGVLEVGSSQDNLQFNESITLEEKWEKMEECVSLGLTKSIGISNFNSEQIDRILKIAKIKPVTNQVECHPYLNQKKLIKFCKEREIIITAYSPLGSPTGAVTPFIEKTPRILEDTIIKQISEKYKKTAAQVILRYMVQLGTVPIPKSSNPKRLAENLNIFDFSLDSQDMLLMDSINRNHRSFKMKMAVNHRDYPFHLEF